MPAGVPATATNLLQPRAAGLFFSDSVCSWNCRQGILVAPWGPNVGLLPLCHLCAHERSLKMRELKKTIGAFVNMFLSYWLM